MHRGRCQERRESASAAPSDRRSAPVDLPAPGQPGDEGHAVLHVSQAPALVEAVPIVGAEARGAGVVGGHDGEAPGGQQLDQRIEAGPGLGRWAAVAAHDHGRCRADGTAERAVPRTEEQTVDEAAVLGDRLDRLGPRDLVLGQGAARAQAERGRGSPLEAQPTDGAEGQSRRALPGDPAGDRRQRGQRARFVAEQPHAVAQELDHPAEPAALLEGHQPAAGRHEVLLAERPDRPAVLDALLSERLEAAITAVPDRPAEALELGEEDHVALVVEDRMAGRLSRTAGQATRPDEAPRHHRARPARPRRPPRASPGGPSSRRRGSHRQG